MNTELEKYESKILRIPESGCWIWMGAVKTHKHPYGWVGYKGKNYNAHRLFYFQRLQVTYFKERLRKKALEKDNHAHIFALGAAIELDLQRSKQLLPKAVFRQLKRKNRLYRMQQNAKALLELHHQIATLIGK